MLQIKRRYNFDQWEPIANYRDGEFEGDDDFVEAFGHLEGRPEEDIIETLTGANMLVERIEEKSDDSRPIWEEMEEKRQRSLEKAEGFAKVDDELMKFYTHIVWYDVEKDAEDVNLEKSPEMWRSSDEVPEFVEEYIKEAVQQDAFWEGSFDELPPGSEQHIRDLFEENMTQPQGWSLSSIMEDLEDLFPYAEKDYLMEITRNEVAALANKAREEAYEDSAEEGEEFLFYWSGPEDHRTTEICSRMKSETNPRHGGTPKPLEEMRELLEEIAEEEKGGLPGRVKEWLPHFQCRHTFVRKVYL